MTACTPRGPEGSRAAFARASALAALATFLGASAPAVFPTHSAYAASPYTNVRVDSSPFLDAEEVTIAVNPSNPSNLVAGANLNYVFYSNDGGLTWTQNRLTSSMGVWGDPCVEFDALGNAYYAHLSWPGSSASWLDRIVVQKSRTGGATWDDGVGVGLNPPKDQDKEWLTADKTDSPYSGSLYLAWTQFDVLGSTNPADSTRILFSHSTDGGATWSAPVRVSDLAGNAIDSDGTMEGAVPAVGPAGEVYMAWAGRDSIWFDRSLDGGGTWGRDRVVAAQPGGWDFAVPGLQRCDGMPATECDAGFSPYRGRIYVMFSDQRNGADNTDVFVCTSDDAGDTWSAPVRVNDDAGAAHQFFPSMAVDPYTGFVHVVFYDRRNTVGDATDVYLATSTDGGATFANVEISASSFTPTSTVFFGDYTDIAALGGMVRPIWMRMDNGDLTVWTALVGLPTGVAEGRPPGSDAAFLEPNTPNPFNPTTSVAFRLEAPADVDLAVFDGHGARVSTLFAGRAPAGRTVVRWNGTDARGVRVASGVYFCRLFSGGRTHVRKMVLLK